ARGIPLIDRVGSDWLRADLAALHYVEHRDAAERRGLKPQGAAGFPGAPDVPSDTPPLGWTATVVRDGRDIADRGDAEPDGLQRPQRRFPARARSAHLDLERAHAVLHRLAAGVLGRHLRRERRRLARALEALRARRRPGDGVALHVGDRDDRVVE